MVQLLLIAVFAVLVLREEFARPWLAEWAPGSVAAAAVGSMAALWLVSHALIWRQGRRMDRRGDLRAVERSDRIVAATRLVAVVGHGFCVLGLGWLDVVRGVVGDLVLVDELLAAAPVLLVYLGGWWSMHPIDRRLREAVVLRDLDEGRPVRPMPSRGAYVLAAVRHQAALILVPMLAIVAWEELLRRGAARLDAPPWFPLVILQVAGMLVVLTLMPVVLRRIWDTVRLDPGPLRDLLEGMCRDHGVRIRELLVWRTHGTMLNGAVMGFAGPLRYILLTDALLETLSGPQVEAVMAHELGHVRRRHMLWLGATVLAAMLLAFVATGIGLARLPTDLGSQVWVRGLGALGAVALALLIFGFVSRRFEWQADAFAVQHLSGYRSGRPAGEQASVLVEPAAVVAMSSALETVARLNHIPRRKFTFRHGSIATRQERLKALIGQRVDKLGPDRVAGVLKLVTGIGLVVGVVLASRLGVS